MTVLIRAAVCMVFVWLAPHLVACPEYESEANRYIERLARRWRWETFWRAGIYNARYQPGSSLTIDLFWTQHMLGFCSIDLGRCASYEVVAERLGQLVSQQSGLGSKDLRSTTGRYIALYSPNAVNWDTEAPKFCTIRFSFPALTTPDAITKRETPEDLAKLSAWLKNRLSETIDADGVELIIPYYSVSDPEINILVRSPARSDSVIFLVHDDASEAGWNIGGHFDPPTANFQIDRLTPLILSSQMISIKIK